MVPASLKTGITTESLKSGLGAGRLGMGERFYEGQRLRVAARTIAACTGPVKPKAGRLLNARGPPGKLGAALALRGESLWRRQQSRTPGLTR